MAVAYPLSIAVTARSTARPERVVSLFRRTIPTGIKHGTVTVLWKGEAFEVTTLRGEGAYTDGRRPDHVFYVDRIEDDLGRRDFTVNAIAFDPVDGSIADPFGGLEDLHARVLRAVGDPIARFSEDGLRILRGARFAATLGFELDPATEAAFRPTLDVFRKVSAERVREEWMKAMKAERPSRAFVVMRRTGILDVTFPELAGLPEGVAGSGFALALEACDRAAREPIARHAARLARQRRALDRALRRDRCMGGPDGPDRPLERQCLGILCAHHRLAHPCRGRAAHGRLGGWRLARSHRRFAQWRRDPSRGD